MKKVSKKIKALTNKLQKIFFLAEILRKLNNLATICVFRKIVFSMILIYLDNLLTFINKPLLSSNAACKLQNDQKFTFLIQNNNFMSDKEIKMMK